jgi:molybdate transport system substrate-binding protein
VAELVARGEAEIGIQQIVAIVPIKGAQLAGPLPAELQNVIVYAAGLASRARNTALARDFIAFMATDQAKRRAASSQARPRRARLRANDRKRLRHRAFMPISA